MLVVNEIVRDVLCNELIKLSKYVPPEAYEHLRSMSDILMSDKDFQYVDDEEVNQVILSAFPR